MNTEKPVNLRTSCLHIRHKLMYCDERHAERGMVDDSSDTRVFFCAQTQEVLGPDNEAVSPKLCLGDRNCYCRGSAV